MESERNGKEVQKHTRDILFSNIVCVPDMYNEFEFVSCWQISLQHLGMRQVSKRELVSLELNSKSLAQAKQREAREAVESQEIHGQNIYRKHRLWVTKIFRGGNKRCTTIL